MIKKWRYISAKYYTRYMLCFWKKNGILYKTFRKNSCLYYVWLNCIMYPNPNNKNYCQYCIAYINIQITFSGLKVLLDDAKACWLKWFRNSKNEYTDICHGSGITNKLRSFYFTQDLTKFYCKDHLRQQPIAWENRALEF